MPSRPKTTKLSKTLQEPSLPIIDDVVNNTHPYPTLDETLEDILVRTKEDPEEGHTSALITSGPVEGAGMRGLSPKAIVLKDLNTRIPTNSYGLPEYIYRADLVPDSDSLDQLEMEEKSEYLENAILELDYAQGFPTLANGEPFWSQLPCEPIEAFRAFTMYLDSPRVRIHQGDSAQAPAVTLPVRQLHLLRMAVGKETHELMSYSHMFYWPQRVRAYDLFTAAVHNKRKEQRLVELEDDHYVMAAKLLKKGEAIMNDMMDDPAQYEVTPANVIALMSKMVQVQRLSVGLSPIGIQGQHDVKIPKNADLEVIMRTITQHSGAAINQTNDEDASKQLLNDPEALRQAQELIIRMGDMSRPKVVGPELMEEDSFD